jgi:hypothetical protein
LNWYCPSRNKYDDHVLLNLQGHIVFMHSNCLTVISICPLLGCN